MDFLKRLPITFLGDLNDVRLINFSVDISEITNLPEGIKVRNFDGRALISMVDVKLHHMHPSFVPSALHFSYRHLAFRLLVDDSEYNNGACKGIYFIKGFSNSPIIVAGSRWLTDYNLSVAKISEKNNEVTVTQNDNFIHYKINEGVIDRNEISELQKTVGAIDRAYSKTGERIRLTLIQREKWPIQPIECTEFSTSYFKTARLEGAFRVFETIHYQWLPAKDL